MQVAMIVVRRQTAPHTKSAPNAMYILNNAIDAITVAMLAKWERIEHHDIALCLLQFSDGRDLGSAR
jgi:hypothetical protein